MTDPVYLAQLNEVARCLYSLDFHFCRWDDATVKEKAKYVQKAHLAKVWWELQLNHRLGFPDQSFPEISADQKLAYGENGR